jgi:DNA end-binding protein Ku
MRAIWNGFISFGLVTIPVSVGLAQQRKDVSFRTLSRATMRPVKQKRWDTERDVEVGPDDTVKGWEVAKGRYVPIEDDELSKFAARQEKTIEIHQFVEVGEVDPVYFDRAYWLEPQERADRPYALLATALEQSGRAALGRFVLSTKEHLVLIRALDGMLALQTLYYSGDVRSSDKDDIAARVSEIEVGEQELAMAEQLIRAGAKEFTPDALRNEARAQLLDFLQAKAAGQEPVVAPEEPEPVQVVDLMAALKASLDAAGVDDAAAEEEQAPAGAS